MTLPLQRLIVGLGVFTAGVVLSAARLPAEPIPVGALGTPAPAAKKQIQEVQDAVARFKSGDFDGAFVLLKDAAGKHAELPPPEIIMAQLFGQANQAGGVQMWLERAVLAVPKDPEAYVIMGDFALRGRRVTDADLLYSKAGSLVPNVKNPNRKKLLEQRIYAGAASVAEARAGTASAIDKAQAGQQWATAQKYLEAWLKLELKPEDKAIALQRLGRALFMQNKAQEARDTLKKAAETDPKVLNWAAQLALLYERREDRAKAKQWMAYALQLKPKDLRTRLVAAQWALGTKQFAQAKEQAAAAMRLDPKSLDAKILRGVVAAFQRDFKAAEMFFEDAHLQSPGNFQASNNLALALCEQNEEAKKRRALEYARANAERHSKVPEAVSTYGWVLYKLGRVDDADRVLSSLLRAGNLSADTAYYIAQVAAEKRRPEEAKRLLKSALKSKRPFSKEQEAKELLEKLNK